MVTSIKSVAVIPAAGRSQRMGSLHKLLMPWGSRTVLDRVLFAWVASQIDRVVVVSRPDDGPLHELVRRFARVDLVIADKAPRDMKRSVEIGLQFFRPNTIGPNTIGPNTIGPNTIGPDDRWLLAPADLPTLTASLIDRVIEAGRQTRGIVVPTFDRRRGHPVSFPWSLADQVARLGDDQGIKQLLEQHPVVELPIEVDEYPQDVDTPEDYRRLREATDAGQNP
jgi:molybdenum cofactor cytidylyltransferase